MLAFTNPSDSVLDPFVGAGTTAIAAIKAGRRAVGIDKNAQYISLTRQRVDAFRQGSLRLRKSGTAIRSPSQTEAVARIPPEWNTAAE